MPLLDDILENRVLGREFKRGVHQEAMSPFKESHYPNS